MGAVGDVEGFELIGWVDGQHRDEAAAIAGITVVHYRCATCSATVTCAAPRGRSKAVDVEPLVRHRSWHAEM